MHYNNNDDCVKWAIVSVFDMVVYFSAYICLILNSFFLFPFLLLNSAGVYVSWWCSDDILVVRN